MFVWERCPTDLVFHQVIGGRDIGNLVACHCWKRYSLWSTNELTKVTKLSCKQAVDPNEKSRALAALAYAETPELTAQTLEFALSSDVRSQDTTSLIARVSYRGSSSLLAAWNFAREWVSPGPCIALLITSFAMTLDENQMSLAFWDCSDFHIPPSPYMVHVERGSFCPAENVCYFLACLVGLESVLLGRKFPGAGLTPTKDRTSWSFVFVQEIRRYCQ